MGKKRDARMDHLFDVLVAHPDGLRKADLVAALECSDRVLVSTLRDLRDLMGDDDTMNVIVTHVGRHQYYRLIGTYDEARPWFDERINDQERRIRTILSVSKSTLRADPSNPRAQVLTMNMQNTLNQLDWVRSHSETL